VTQKKKSLEIPSFTNEPAGQPRSKIKQGSSLSGLGTEFNGDKAIGTMKGLRANGLQTDPNASSVDR